MAFESLHNTLFTEINLVINVLTQLQREFDLHKGSSYFIKLGAHKDGCAKIIWEKSFTDPNRLMDFYWDTPTERTCLLVRFSSQDNHYLVLAHTMTFSNTFTVTRDSWYDRRYIITSNNEDIESTPMISRELFEKGLGELTERIHSTKRSKAV